MKAALNALAGALMITSFAIAPAGAQAPEGARYVATYVEVMPTATKDGAAMLRQFRDATRKEAGNLRAEAAQRIGQPNQFVILEAWQDQAALDAHAKAAGTAQFHDKLKPIEDAPYDDRVTYVLSVGPVAAKLDGAAVVTVTHVDVVPTYKDQATALVKQIAEDGRKDAGNLRYEALTQVSRPNHFTVVAAWRDRTAADAYGMDAKTRAFREQLGPMAGALYDERFYQVLD
jgi:quinol monooxygenase YgiN